MEYHLSIYQKRKSHNCICVSIRKENLTAVFEHLTGKKNVVADALSRLDIDSLKIQEEDL
jgi:hypothetical protein